MRADLDTLLIAVYCAACSLFPAPESRGRGRPQRTTDNELLCLMVAQMLLGQPSDRRFLKVAERRLGHLFPQLPSQSRYNERCRRLAPKLVTLWRAIAYELPGFHDTLSYVDTTPLPCGAESGHRQSFRAGALVRVRLQRRSLPLLLGHAAGALVRP